jgi:hypothetical protein
MLMVVTLAMLRDIEGRDVQHPKVWDLHGYSDANCTDITLSWRGLGTWNCTSTTDSTILNFSFKSPTKWRMCMWTDTSCTNLLGTVDDGWEICQHFIGWEALSVVAPNQPC